jgi:Na+/melibiose symporter-like transporter
MGISVGIAFSNFALGAAGYNADLPAQPENVLLTLRLFISIVPAVVLLLSFLVMQRYPISRERHAEIRAQIAARKSS